MITPSHLKRLTLPVLLSLALVGCSGGSDFGSGMGDSSKSDQVVQVDIASLEISASSSILLSKGTNEVTIFAVAKDKNNSVISDIPITFAVDNSATIIANDNNNDKATTKTATVSSGLDTTPRTLTVTVTAGAKVQTITLQVDDSSVEPEDTGPEIASLDISTTADKLYSLGSNEVTISVIAKNKENNVVPDAKIFFSVDSDALILPDAANDTASVKTAKLSSGLGHPEARTLTVTIKSGDFVKTIKIDVIKATDPVLEIESKVADLEISASSRQLFSAGVNPVIVSAIAKDTNNNTLADAVITFKVNNNATITPNESNETATVKTASVTPGLNHPENRKLDIEVTAGGLTKNLQVDIVGTTVTLEGPDSIATDNPTNYSVKLQDSENKPLGFQAVQVSSSAGSEITPINGSNTNAVGEMVFAVRAISDGEDIITVQALGALAEKKLHVSGNNFSLQSATEEITISTPETISMSWTKDGVSQANKTIQLSATRGILSPLTEVKTNSDGEATFTIQSETAGGTVITATTEDGLSAILSREFIATTPHYINTQASPTVIAPHGISNLIAKVRDINDNPVKNKLVYFNLEDKVNGTLSSSSATTDSLGRANITYTASDLSSAKDGVHIKTYVEGNITIKDEVNLTVGGDALRIVLGHNEKIEKDGIFYKQTYGVIVTDSAGNPVKDQEIAFTITPTHYYKGQMQHFQGETSSEIAVDKIVWIQSVTAACKSEDLDNDGNLDNGEDENGNGTLEPTHDATVTTKGKTDEEGKLSITVIYPQSRALWSRQRLSSTVLVEGTEFVEHIEFDLPILASALEDLDIAPPNRISPYGISPDCSIADGPIQLVSPVDSTKPTEPTIVSEPHETLCAENIDLSAEGAVFCVDSSPNAYITEGKSFKVSNESDGFVFSSARPYGEERPHDLSFTVEGNIAFDVHKWEFKFAPPQDTPLSVGMYKFASRYPAQAITQPGLNFSGDGRENNKISGHFEILEIEFDETDKLKSFAANFVQYGEKEADKWTLGKLRYKSKIPLSVSSTFPK